METTYKTYADYIGSKIAGKAFGNRRLFPALGFEPSWFVTSAEIAGAIYCLAGEISVYQERVKRYIGHADRWRCDVIVRDADRTDIETGRREPVAKSILIAFAQDLQCLVSEALNDD